MSLENAVYPDRDQIESLMKSEADGPVSMLNLLKFKEKAAYEDGRETELSGFEAYQLYAREMRKIVEREGGKFVFLGGADQLVVGSGEMGWQSVGIVEYPSRQEFIRITSLPEVQEIGVHRAAGLEGQLLIAMSDLTNLA